MDTSTPDPRLQSRLETEAPHTYLVCKSRAEVGLDPNYVHYCDMRDMEIKALKLERERDEMKTSLEGLYEAIGIPVDYEENIEAIELIQSWQKGAFARDAAHAEIENIKAALLDPNAVHVNMLRGVIAPIPHHLWLHVAGLTCPPGFVPEEKPNA